MHEILPQFFLSFRVFMGKANNFAFLINNFFYNESVEACHKGGYRHF